MTITTTIYKNAKIQYKYIPDTGLGAVEGFQIDRVDTQRPMGIAVGEIIDIAGAGLYRVCSLCPLYSNVSTLEKEVSL